MFPHRVIVDGVHGNFEVSNILLSIVHFYYYFIRNGQVKVRLRIVTCNGDVGVD